HLLHLVGGVETGLDALGQGHLLLGVEQGDLTDLLEVGADGVGGSGEFGVLACLTQGGGLVLIPDGGTVVFFLFLFLLAEWGDLVVLLQLVDGDEVGILLVDNQILVLLVEIRINHLRGGLGRRGLLGGGLARGGLLGGGFLRRSLTRGLLGNRLPGSGGCVG